MGFVGKNKFAVFDKTFYNNEDIVIIGIVNRVFKFRQFDNKVYNDRIPSSFKYKQYLKIFIKFVL